MSKIRHSKHFSKRQTPNPGCVNGAFFKSPKSGDVIDTSQKFNIEWDTTFHCFSTQGVDIYLYAPFTQQSVIHEWAGVNYQAGSFQTSLNGPWWNSTKDVQLQLRFVQSGTPLFMSAVPSGPMFHATFNTTDYGLKNPSGGESTSTTSSNGGILQIIDNAYKNAGLPKGSIAAAVLVPLIAIAIGVAIFVKLQRAKEAEKRKRWSQAVDRRMSAISSDWKGLAPNAQSEAIRQSIAIMRDSRASVARMSQLIDARPDSTLADGGQAGVGVGARKGTGVGLRNPDLGPAQFTQRKSAVSFAADTRFSRPSTDVPSMPRPSADTQRSRASRAFHTAISMDDPVEMMSPTQVGGPTMLGDRDIRQLDLGSDAGVAPALTMMQHDNSDFLHLDHSPLDSGHSMVTTPSAAFLSPHTATPFTASTPPSPAYGNQPQVKYSSNNPFEGFTRGPSNMLTPDAMLRAYASREREGPAKPGTPMIVAHPASPQPSVRSQRTIYPALDAPAQPVPILRGELVPGPLPRPGTLYSSVQGQARMSEGRYSVAEDHEAYGGYGRAT